MSNLPDVLTKEAAQQKTKAAKPSPRRRNRWGLVLRLLVAVLAVAFALFPIIWIISASFNPAGSLASQKLIPDNASLENYQTLLNDPIHPFLRWVVNSLKVSSITAILGVISIMLSAYSFSRFRFKGRRQLMLALLLIQVFPTLLMFVAIFYLFQQLGQYIPAMGLNQHAPLVLTYLGTQMGIQIWLMKGFFDSIPRDIDESALVDGASHWQIFWRLIFPLARPMIVIVALLVFIASYQEFVLASVLLKDKTQYTLMVGLYLFVSENFSNNWGVFAAGGLLGALPIVVLYQTLQDQIIGGLTAGAVKG
ncbi:MAG: sugar ABC transporter permease [Anaerolineales bacterium]|nr:sugar ABC transporter permease [Anaerolineales bacterium]MBS3752169.1 sugar ABC transporter permease [Anaerolineales bacterium]